MKRSEGVIDGPQMQFTPAGVAWLGVALVVGAIAWYKSINLVLLIVYVMIALVVLNGVLARINVRRASARRLAVGPLFAGERSEYGVRVTNLGRRAVTVAVEDRSRAGTTNFLAYRVRGAKTLDCTASRAFPMRGRFGGPVVLVSSYPFGFVTCQLPGDATDEVIVLPAPGVAEPDGLRRWVIRQAGGDGRSRKVLRRVTTDRAEVRGVRGYRTGDPIRDIHWRTTARRGEPMVREYDTAPSPELVLVVEAWLPPTPTPADRDRLEAALSLAATIAVTWRRAFDSPITVVVPGHGAGTAHSEEHMRAALAPLADVTGGPEVEAPSATVFAGHLARGARVVVSSRSNSPFAGALARSTGKPFATVCPTDRLPWYQPPKTA
ncbi:Uncharacterized protein OS=Blastopirellula marina DSM 3645 GN=DSM3645_05365 PE=4 SV=1: DUF58 [Gemmata massiliana]|uniref:DUF58 domain-containing protein n=1 Tax=Gemmata massiliana TaxID=1210884 RepID=A0A6P2CYM4_9BACT|nr:DUF58 domain-containing protein [Gemmata massiliana]VTR93486.1 Uncharacterized protein OS=Blastopirellula marina DSM 3645 GN=DSM3645_05365 PE=4 SV=1: DUF58 [Gemmata massiliana]